MSKILIIGASKGIGKQTVNVAVQAGHQVTAFARHTESLSPAPKNLYLIDGDVQDFSSVMKVMADQEVVICTLGLPTLQAIGPPVAKRSFVLTSGTSNIVQAMHDQGVNRLLCVSAIGAGDSSRQCTLTARLVLRYGLRWLFSEKDRQEEIIKKSGLNWTIIRPTALTNGPRNNPEIASEMPAGLLTQVSRIDVAHALLGSINKAETKREALIVSYPPRFGDSLRWLSVWVRSRP